MRIHDATEQAYKKGYRDGHEDALCLRPCLVDGKPATFHGWVRYDEERLQLDVLTKTAHLEAIARTYRATGVMDASGRIVTVQQVGALVEYPDGSVGRVMPELITFLDRREG